LALVTPYLQDVMGYPIISAGYILGARGIGTMVAMMVVGRLSNVVDPRIMLFSGLALSTWSLYELIWISPDMSATTLVVVSIAQGLGLGLIFVPLNTIALATLDPRLRTEGAAIWTLIRNLGSSVGVSIVIAQLTSTITLMHARLDEHMTPFNPGLQAQIGGILDPTTTSGMAGLENLLTGQATLIAYSNDFLIMTLLSLCAFPMLLLLSRSRTAAIPARQAEGHAMD
jgi:DHA2 family multidrug resistance protein